MAKLAVGMWLYIMWLCSLDFDVAYLTSYQRAYLLHPIRRCDLDVLYEKLADKVNEELQVGIELL